MSLEHEDPKKTNTSAPPPVNVRIDRGKAEKTEFCFTAPFRIGRGMGCEVQIVEPTVSRTHAEVVFVGGKWWLHDLQSANGTYVDGEKVERVPLGREAKIRLGVDGPLLFLTIQEVSKVEEAPPPLTVTHYMKRYFGDAGDENVGQHTMMIRRAFDRARKKQRKKYTGIITIVAFLFLAAGTYAVFKHMEVRKQRLLAADVFYAMKSLELEVAGFLKAARLSKDPKLLQQVQQYRDRRREMEERYEQFVDALGVYSERISEQERIILRIARIFGECEVTMPPGFVQEILKYVKKWQSTDKLKKAIERAQQNGYIEKIAETLLAHDMPPQLFYLALQESGFNVNACGPKTRYGIAKGMWQFIPSTAVQYGLRTGPLVRLRRPDPRDERHHFGKSTLAAAQYLRDIYDTEAQASGLLVIASYNWGERRVIELIRKMPENPRERNFWHLLGNYRGEVPQETHDYVYYIIAAAVIGENPPLFGFDFDNPLAAVEAEGS